MSFNISDFFSRKFTLALIAALIGIAAIAFKLSQSGDLIKKPSTIDDIYQNNNELIITDTILPPDTVIIPEADPYQGFSK